MSSRLLAALALAALPIAWSPPAAAQGIPVDVDVRVVPLPSPAGVLSIRRVEIAFPNGRGEITVPLDSRLAARATLDYAGNGPLLGRWVVDGRPLQEFNQSLAFGGTVVLETAAAPGLPTFEPGLHEVTLQLTTPAVGFALPVVRYVVESAPGPGRGAITLVEPADGAEVAASVRTAVGGAQPGIVFTWSQASLAAPRYLLEVYDAAARLVASAIVDQVQSHLMPPAALAALPVGNRFTWRVRALGAQGQELAVSGGSSFRLVSPAAIQLVTPAEGESIALPYRFSWTHPGGPTQSVTISGAIGGSAPGQGYELRVYRNDAALRADLQALQTTSQGAVTIGTPGGASRLPLEEPQPDPWAPIFRATTPGKWMDVTAADLAAAGSGSALRWAVVLRDAGGQVVAVSEVGGFVLDPQVRTVGGLPAVLEMAGQEIAVRAYGPGASLGSLAGDGTMRFRKDRSRRDIPLPFQGLAAGTPYVERRRVAAGSGYGATVTIALTLRVAVTSGRIAERFAPPLAMDLAGYPARLSALTLQEGAGPSPATLGARGGGPPAGGLDAGALGAGALADLPASRSGAPSGPGAWADLDVDLPAHVRLPGGGAVTASLPATRLGAGGDFYRELTSAEAPSMEVAASAAGPLRYQRLGTLVADFSSERDWVGPGGAYAADGQIFLADGLAELPAAALFPVLEPASIRLTAGVTALVPGAFRASFDALESDAISPLVPAGYGVAFTGGKLAVSEGELDARTLRLDGRATLPPSVHRPSGGAAVVPFRGMAASGSSRRKDLDVWLEATVEAGDLEWGIGPKPAVSLSVGPGTTAMRAPPAAGGDGTQGGETGLVATPATTSTGAAKSAKFAGLREGTESSPPETTSTAAAKSAEVTGLREGVGSSPPASTPAATPTAAVEAGRPFVLREARGSLRLPFATASPDLAPAGVALSSGWLESPFAVDPGSGSQLAPSDVVDLRIRAAGARGSIASAPPPPPSGQIAESGSDRELLARRRTMKLGDFQGTLRTFSVELFDGAVTRSSVAGSVMVPKPADLSLEFTGASISSTGEIVGPSLQRPASIALPFWRVVASPNALELSRSFLRLRGGGLRFPVDAVYGGDELGPLALGQLDIGADGQVKAATMDGTSATFLGIPFALDSESAVSFAPGASLAAGPAQALVTLSGLLSFPVLNRAMRVTVDHTASGAAVHFADARYALGNDAPESIYAHGEMSFVNGYPKGKSWKEFLGLAELKVLGTADLIGLANFGRDAQGLYQKFGIGLGVDADRAASLYHSGAVSVGVKLGAAATSFATGGNPHAQEVTALVGDVAALAAGGFKTQADMDRAMFKTIGDAVRLARLIHLDTGGRVGDGVETALSIAAAGLSVAQDLTGKTYKNLSPQQAAVLVLTALDVAFPVLEKSDFARGKPETLAVLAFVRLGAKATRLALDDGKLSDKDWFALGKQLFQSVRPLSEDAVYRVAMDVMAAVFTAAEGAQGASDPVLLARIGSGVLGAVRKSGVLQGPDWKNVLVISQALLDAAIAAKDLPWPDNALALGVAVLDAAGGAETDYGSDQDDRKVKAVMKLARRTLDAVAVTGAGIPYDKAAVAVKDAYDSAAVAADFGAPPRFGVQETVQGLIGLWDRLKYRPLADSLADLRQILCENGGLVDCANLTGFSSQVNTALRDASLAQRPEALIAAVARLEGLAAWANRAGTAAGSSESYLARMRSLVAPATAGLRKRAEDVTVQVIILRILDAETPRQAAEAYGHALQLKETASFLSQALFGGHGDLDWTSPVVDPARQALSMSVAKHARSTLAALAATSSPPEVTRLWEDWRFIDPGPGDPSSPPVRDAFRAKAAAIENDCIHRMFAEPFSTSHIFDECDDALLRLPGADRTRLAGANASLVPVMDSVQWDSEVDLRVLWLEGVFRSRAPEGDELPSDPVIFGAWRLQTDIREGKLDAAGWNAMLEALRANARRGAIDEGTVYGFALVRQQGSFAPDAAWVGEMLSLLRPRAASAAAAALAQLDIERTSPSDAVQSAASYWLHTSVLGQSAAGMAASVPRWIAAARKAACTRRTTMAAWLTGVLPFAEPAQVAEIREGLERLPGGCTAISYDPNTEIAKIAASAAEIQTELERLVQSPMPEEDKKERIAWFVAARVESLTAGFTGEVPEEKVLRAVHTQAKLVNQFRLRPRAERIAAVGEIVVAAMGDLFPQSAGAAPVVKAVFRGLNKFVEAGGESLPPGRKALELVSAIALEATPSPFGKTLVGGWLGLLKSHTAATITLTAIPLAVAGGVGLALHDKVKMSGGKLDLPATLAALKIEPDDFWTSMGKAVPVLTEIGESAVKLHGLLDGLTKSSATPAQRLAALDKFVTEAPKLAQVGPYVAAILRPEAHLLAPDRDQGVYLPNAVLAFLGTAREKLPGNASWGFMGTCPTVSLTAGVNARASNTAEWLLCAVDVGRELVQKGMSAFFGGPPSPYQLLDAQARERLEEMRRSSVFAQAGADENLSGLSGQLEVRPGATAPAWTLDVLATLQAKPVLDSAALLTVTSQDHLRLELANANPAGDTRTTEALGRIGYQFPPGASRLFGTPDLGNPLKYLLVDFDGRAACFTGRLALEIKSPVGTLGTSETGLDVCWKPGWFALRSSISTPIPGVPIARIRSTIGLCAGTRGNFTGFGLDLGVGGSLDIPIPLLPYGFYAGLDLGLGLSAGNPGVLIAGHLDSQIGLYKTGLREDECIGHPLVDIIVWQGFRGGGWEATGTGRTPTGICRSGLGFSLDVLANLASQGGYLKARGGFDVAGLWVGGWLYSNDAGLQGGAGNFPASLGGFGGPNMRQGASVCQGAGWPAGGAP